jgi:hypothetical protein
MPALAKLLLDKGALFLGMVLQNVLERFLKFGGGVTKEEPI